MLLKSKYPRLNFPQSFELFHHWIFLCNHYWCSFWRYLKRSWQVLKYLKLMMNKERFWFLQFFRYNSLLIRKRHLLSSNVKPVFFMLKSNVFRDLFCWFWEEIWYFWNWKILVGIKFCNCFLCLSNLEEKLF